MKAAFVTAALAVACATDPVSVSTTSNGAMNVELLFEHDGCKVYRFTDGGRYRYYAHCAKGTATTTSASTESCGKNCARQVDETITTETR